MRNDLCPRKTTSACSVSAGSVTLRSPPANFTRGSIVPRGVVLSNILDIRVEAQTENASGPHRPSGIMGQGPTDRGRAISQRPGSSGLAETGSRWEGEAKLGPQDDEQLLGRSDRPYLGAALAVASLQLAVAQADAAAVGGGARCDEEASEVGPGVCAGVPVADLAIDRRHLLAGELVNIRPRVAEARLVQPMFALADDPTGLVWRLLSSSIAKRMAAVSDSAPTPTSVSQRSPSTCTSRNMWVRGGIWPRGGRMRPRALRGRTSNPSAVRTSRKRPLCSKQ